MRPRPEADAAEHARLQADSLLGDIRRARDDLTRLNGLLLEVQKECPHPDASREFDGAEWELTCPHCKLGGG